MKFGGTSVADQSADRAADRHRPRAAAGRRAAGGRRCARSDRRRLGAVEGHRSTARHCRQRRRRRHRRRAEPTCASCDSATRRSRKVIADPVQREQVVQFLDQEFDESRAHRPGAGRAARGVAALARRDCRHRRDPEQPHRRRRADLAWAARDLDRRASRRRHRRASTPSAAPLFPETTASLMAHVDPPLAAGRIPVIGGFVGATAGRRDDDARPRRIGLFGGDRRRVSRRRRDSDLDRRRRHAHGRSAHRRRSVRRAAPVVCRSVGAGLLRRQGPAPGDDSAGGRPQHSGPHSQLASSARARHADHRRAPAIEPAADRHRFEERGQRRQHHLDADADGARLPAPAVRGVRALEDAGRRHHAPRRSRCR